MKINPRQIERAMKKMGIKSEEIDSEEVIIKSGSKEIVISNPQVTKVNMGGQDTFQIAGEVSERSAEDADEGVSEDDVKVVMDRTGASEEQARQALEDTDGDLAQAIIKLKNKG
jgi:nascent polypeptide-associated complex subunit alpha